jgi:hypothetical protein
MAIMVIMVIMVAREAVVAPEPFAPGSLPAVFRRDI